MKRIPLSLLALSISVASGSVCALQALNDSSMQDVTAQGGLTIETTSLAQDGFVSGTEKITFTQKDYEDTGDVTLAIDGTSTYMYSLVDDGSGNLTRTPTTIKRTYDIGSDGSLSIKTHNIDKMDTKTGAMSVNGKYLNGGSEINVWEFKPGSYLETFIENNPDGAKIKSRTVMTIGSGYSQKAFANGIVTATDVVYLPAAGETEFMSELILASDSHGGLRLEFGETRGTFEIQNLRLLNESDSLNVFDGEYEKGVSFYDVGYGDVEVNSGYMTIRPNMDANGQSLNGIRGEMASDINIGKLYIRTKEDGTNANQQQFNINNASFKVNGEIEYDLKLVDFGRAGGIEAQLVSKNTTADIVLGSLTFSNDSGNESANMASIAVKDFSLDGGTLDIGMYGYQAGEAGSPFAKDVSVKQVVNMDRASFKLTIAGEDISDTANANQPIVQGDVVINNYSSEQFSSNTKRGMETISNSSYSMSINALRAGNGVNYQGQSGRLVMSNYQQMNAHTIIEPLR